MSESAITDRASVTPAGMRIVELLVGKPPQTVSDLVEVMGVTRTAVTEQLNELIELGFVERTTERLPGRGRPRHIYSATTAALVLLFASNQRLLVPAIWRAIREIGGQSLADRVLNRVSRSLADHYRGKIKAKRPKERLRQMMSLLQQEGVVVNLEEGEDGSLIVHKRTCPFLSMYEESGAVCSVDLEMMKEIVGADVIQTACRHHGAPCCSFSVAPTNGRSS